MCHLLAQLLRLPTNLEIEMTQCNQVVSHAVSATSSICIVFRRDIANWIILLYYCILCIAYLGVIVTTAVFAVTLFVCIAVFTTILILLIKKESRHQGELTDHRSATKVTLGQNYDEVVHFSQPDSAVVDTRKNIAYAVHTKDPSNKSN